jgi:methenyltetrahydrofolate cyclohydrolase
MAFADRSVAEVLDRIAAREPAPGGGSAAAWTAATAGALVQMTAAFARGGAGAQKDRTVAVADRAAELRAHELELAEQDERSYAPVLEALRLGASDATRDARLAAALSAAAEVPLAVAAGAAELAELAAAVARDGSPHLVGDATAAALLAEAATRAAVRLVELNLAHAPEDGRLRAAGELVARAGAARAAVLGEA